MKDCSNCLVPHGRGSYSYIMKKYPELMELAKRIGKSRKDRRDTAGLSYFPVTTWANPAANSRAARSASSSELPAVPISTSMLPVVRCWL